MSSAGAPGGTEPARLGGTVAPSAGTDGVGLIPVDPLHGEATTTRSVSAAIPDIRITGGCTCCATTGSLRGSRTAVSRAPSNSYTGKRPALGTSRREHGTG